MKDSIGRFPSYKEYLIDFSDCPCGAPATHHYWRRERIAYNKWLKNKLKTEPPVTEYRGRFICRAGDYYRVKADPNDDYSLHHGSFDDVDKAKDWIDYREDGE